MERFFLHSLYKLYKLKFFFTRPVIVGVRVMLIRNEQEVLLVRHSYQDGWLLPGGGVKRRETIEQAARRECREEVGAEIGEMELAGVFTNFFEYKNDHIILFISHDFNIHPKTDIEIEHAEFYPLKELPPDTMSGSRRRIEKYVQGQLVPRSGTW